MRSARSGPWGAILRSAQYPLSVVAGLKAERERVRVLAEAANVSRDTVVAQYREISGSPFERGLEERLDRLARTRVGARGLLSRENARFLYVLTRCTRPGVVIETGVCNGMSTAYLLQAMHENGCGQLHSVDLPNHPTQGAGPILPDGHETGELVPEELRASWSLVLGDARDCLEPLLARARPVDIFVHDSRHTCDHMTWEYTTAWPCIRKGGFLVSDDVHWNNAFPDFVRDMGGTTCHISLGQGTLRKD